jgi:TetR/AcrR family transcriptional regulator, tetracycline repressor protein
MPLRRDEVVRAALGLLDEVGLDAFTTRALTSRLGVQRGALYWHVKSKRELLGAVADLIVQPVLDEMVAVEDDWADAFAAFAHRLRDVMLAHRDGARLIAGYVVQPRPVAMWQLEAKLADMAAQGVPAELAMRFADTMASYVTGYVLQEQALPAEAELAPDDSTPTVAEAVTTPGRDSASVFAASVGTIVLGMRAEVAQTQAGRTEARQVAGVTPSAD